MHCIFHDFCFIHANVGGIHIYAHFHKCVAWRWSIQKMISNLKMANVWDKYGCTHLSLWPQETVSSWKAHELDPVSLSDKSFCRTILCCRAIGCVYHCIALNSPVKFSTLGPCENTVKFQSDQFISDIELRQHFIIKINVLEINILIHRMTLTWIIPRPNFHWCFEILCSREEIKSPNPNPKCLCIPELVVKPQFKPWWCYQMETFSALLSFCEGNPLVIEGFPSERSVTGGFYVFFDRRLNKRLSKQLRRRWFDTPSHPLWRHCNSLVIIG